MTTIVVQENEQDPPAQNQPELSPEASETIEAVTETAVEIAQIEADKEIAIAEIHAETAQIAIEADAENRENVQWLREALASAEGKITELEVALSLATMPVEPIPLEPLPLETLEEATETAETIPSLTQNDTSDQTAETLTELIVESDAEKVEILDLPPALTVPKKGPIIRLV